MFQLAARSIGVLLLAAALLLLPACGDAGSAAEVRAVYDEYNATLNRRDGEAFLKVIDPENIRHYDQYVRIAREGTREQIAQLGSMGRGYVLMIRNRLKPEELAKLDGAGFVKICVERDWFFKEDEGEKFTLGRISVHPPRASAELLVNRERSGERWEFVQVDGRWLVNDECMDRVHEKDLADAARRLRVGEDRLLFESEEDVTGKEVDPAIFNDPPKLAPAAPPPEAAAAKKKPKKR